LTVDSHHQLNLSLNFVVTLETFQDQEAGTAMWGYWSFHHENVTRERLEASVSKKERRQRSTKALALFILCCIANSRLFLIGNNYRHPLSSSPRRRLNQRQIRFLTLGGPSTWGLGLEQPQTTGYPWKLSPSVHNAAQRVGGPTLGSLCTQSIVGDSNIYDVIVLEFSLSEEYKTLSLLAQRLRKRFPSSRIIFVQLWSPSQTYYKLMGGNITLFDDWRTDQGSKLSFDSSAFLHALQEKNWYFLDNQKENTAFKDLQKDMVISQIIQQVGGSLYQLSRSTNANQALNEAMQLFAEIRKDEYDEDDTLLIQYPLSSHGHELVANAILNIVDTQSILDQSIEERNLLGSWGSGDSCQLWYETGMLNGKTLASSKGFWMNQFSKTQEEKYALELSLQGGSVTVSNPFDTERMVYLTYMTTSEFSYSNKVYPSIRVQILGKNSVIINPQHDDNLILHHISRTTAIGKIPPGESILHFDPVEKTVAPFRVIGISLLANEKLGLGIPTEFLFSPEPAHVEELHTYLDLL
jgi:hypothetical protein